jgi:hypothetical protein
MESDSRLFDRLADINESIRAISVAIEMASVICMRQLKPDGGSAARSKRDLNELSGGYFLYILANVNLVGTYNKALPKMIA